MRKEKYKKIYGKKGKEKMDITSCSGCKREIFIIDDDELEKNMLCDYCKKKRKEKKRRGKNRQKVILEEVRGIYYIKIAHYFNFSYYSGKTIDCYNTRKEAMEFIKELKLRIVK